MTNDAFKELKETIVETLTDRANEEAYIIACEIVGPNSYEFEEVLEEQSSKLFETYRLELITALEN